MASTTSSSGAHWPGQEKAPRALHEAGLVERLGSSGLLAQDHGDLPPARFRPDPGRHPQSLDAVVSVARAVAGRVEEILKIGQVPFVVGGDCTVELGVISGSLRAGEDPALLYLDGGVDLYTPATNPTGILDSMGVAHMVRDHRAQPRPRGRARGARRSVRPERRRSSQVGERRVMTVISGRHRKRRRAWTNPSPRLVYWIMPLTS